MAMDYEDHQMLQRFLKGLHDEDVKERRKQTEALVAAFNNVANEIRLLREELAPKTLEKKQLPSPKGGAT